MGVPFPLPNPQCRSDPAVPPPHQKRALIPSHFNTQYYFNLKLPKTNEFFSFILLILKYFLVLFNIKYLCIFNKCFPNIAPNVSFPFNHFMAYFSEQTLLILIKFPMNNVFLFPIDIWCFI